MERVGWRFWRCWGSSFRLDPEACIADLVATLNELSIKPALLENQPSAHTEFRVVGDVPRTQVDPPIPLEEESRGSWRSDCYFVQRRAEAPAHHCHQP